MQSEEGKVGVSFFGWFVCKSLGFALFSCFFPSNAKDTSAQLLSILEDLAKLKLKPSSKWLNNSRVCLLQAQPHLAPPTSGPLPEATNSSKMALGNSGGARRVAREILLVSEPSKCKLKRKLEPCQEQEQKRDKLC